jgi:predicted O-methyltransferase YrrM
MSLTFAKTEIMELINPVVQQYAEAFSTPEDDLLREINLFTAKPFRISNVKRPFAGKLLEMVSQMIQPRRILVCFTGYSALCLAKGRLPAASYIPLK